MSQFLGLTSWNNISSHIRTYYCGCISFSEESCLLHWIFFFSRDLTSLLTFGRKLLRHFCDGMPNRMLQCWRLRCPIKFKIRTSCQAKIVQACSVDEFDVSLGWRYIWSGKNCGMRRPLVEAWSTCVTLPGWQSNQISQKFWWNCPRNFFAERFQSIRSNMM